MRIYLLKHTHKFGLDVFYFLSDDPYEDMDPVKLAKELGVSYEPDEEDWGGDEELELEVFPCELPVIYMGIQMSQELPLMVKSRGYATRLASPGFGGQVIYELKGDE